MRFLSLFAGIGGFDLGLERAGHKCVGQVEIDPFCRRVLRARFASVEQQADVRVAAFDDSGGGIDLLCGGFPCQDLSIAGKRAGLAGERSGLFWEIVRIAKIIKPRWGLFENVPGLLSSRGGADMWTVIAGLREFWPVVGYRILDSRHFGVAQRRRRVFFVCGPTEARLRAVLFEPEGGAGHPAAGGEEGTRTAARLTSGVGAASNNPGRRREDDVNLVAHALSRPTSNGRLDPNGEDFVIGTIREHTRPGSNTDHSIVTGLNGSGLRGRQPGSAASFVATLNSGGNDGGFRTEPGEHLVTHSLSAEGADASEDGTGRGTPLTWNWQSGGDVRHSLGLPNLQANQVPAIGVRRLTPLECERLQGFPDGWTCLCGTDDHEMGCRCPDSPRYRALGNAVTVNVIEWIGRRLVA